MGRKGLPRENAEITEPQPNRAKRLECAASRRCAFVWAENVSNGLNESAGMRRTPNASRPREAPKILAACEQVGLLQRGGLHGGSAKITYSRF
jgi:hypothetical protein